MSGLEASLILIGVLLGVMAILAGAGWLAFYLLDRLERDRARKGGTPAANPHGAGAGPPLS
jgi:hypothetical protein